jgi:hypothetical protein
MLYYLSHRFADEDNGGELGDRMSFLPGGLQNSRLHCLGNHCSGRPPGQ